VVSDNCAEFLPSLHLPFPARLPLQRSQVVSPKLLRTPAADPKPSPANLQARDMIAEARCEQITVEDLPRSQLKTFSRRRTPQCALGAALRERFAHNVRQFRVESGMTQLELASAAGVGRTFINQVERGHFSVNLETVGAISAALGVCPTLLIQAAE